MRVLAIESSSVTASAAIVTDDIVTAEYTTNFKQTHSQTLLPMIDEICTMTETPIESINLIAVSSGPGSFTGLRIGSATGKGIGLALDKPIVSVPTLDALAMNVIGTDRLVCPVMDARRGNVYTGIYRFDYGCDKDESGLLEILLESSLMQTEKLIERLNEMQQSVIFLGDAAALYSDVIKEKMTVPFIFAPAHMSMPRAASVAVLGMRMQACGKAANAREHVPDYLRPSQAERERNNQ
ncbi:MAG: tRNA (adenosine(37)-N6)-threonylcarbamoyltransferase complex dimerization subunit type 1 TsaB [Clostridia bacterium]|nr:tRNA (adenosine(37)-N6)-threonylcarbamoyltransferase complex dimerization subunit type 1 TsaB [Clostridia bacterium]